MKIAVDFDGTIVDHRFPDIGKPVPGAFRWLEALQDAGAKLILFTMRSDGQQYGDVLTDAVEFCRKNGIEFYGVNRDPDQDASSHVPAFRELEDAIVERANVTDVEFAAFIALTGNPEFSWREGLTIACWGRKPG